MSGQTIVLVVAAVVVVAALLVVVLAAMSRRTIGAAPQARPESEQWVAEAKIEPEEQVASPVAEEIEERVRAQVAEYPDLRRAKIDFVTGPDGSLEIHLDAARYQSVDDVPDLRLRKAIQAAVQEWNSRKAN